jgi:hypothetical protein
MKSDAQVLRTLLAKVDEQQRLIQRLISEQQKATQSILYELASLQGREMTAPGGREEWERERDEWEGEGDS